MTEPRGGAEALEAVIASMWAKKGELGSRVHADLTDDVPAYRAVPEELLDHVWGRHFERTLEVLRDGRVPPREDLDEAEVARDRVTRGVSLSDGLRAFRRALGAIRDLFIAEATRHGLDPLVAVERTRALWELADAESLQITSVHREAEMSAALFDARRRTAFLRGLLFGTLSAAEIHSGAAVYGLDPAQSYHAIKAWPNARSNPDRSQRSLESLGRSHGRTAMIAVLDDTIAGVVEAKPAVGELAVTAGLGPATSLGRVHHSFRTASRLLEAAGAYGLRGVYDLGDLSWRLAVASEPEIADMLLDRHLRPLAAEGEFGSLVEESVRAYLRAGRHVGAAAQALHVHVNTMRYRLRRYEELTGVRLDSPETVVEISWALAARELRSAKPSHQALDHHTTSPSRRCQTAHRRSEGATS